VSEPSHYQLYTAIGQVQDIICKGPALTWLPLVVDTGEPTYLAVAYPGPPPEGLAKGDLVWIRGVLRTEHQAGSRHGLPFVQVRFLERLRRPATV
jgi:hypothetical protein